MASKKPKTKTYPKFTSMGGGDFNSMKKDPRGVGKKKKTG